MKIILYRPQIPQNTGNIIRTCQVTGTDLILVRPFAFKTDDKSLKRAGMDYFKDVSIEEIDDLFLYLKETSTPFYFFSSHASRAYTDAAYTEETLLIFGSESAGLPQKYHQEWPGQFVTIPMKKESRCLNLATSVGIALYEGLRQQEWLIIK